MFYSVTNSNEYQVIESILNNIIRHARLQAFFTDKPKEGECKSNSIPHIKLINTLTETKSDSEVPTINIYLFFTNKSNESNIKENNKIGY